MANLWFDDNDILDAFNGTFEEEYHRDAIDVDKIVTHIGGWIIEREGKQWVLFCNGSSVYWHKDLAKVYVAFSSHLAGIGK